MLQGCVVSMKVWFGDGVFDFVSEEKDFTYEGPVVVLVASLVIAGALHRVFLFDFTY